MTAKKRTNRLLAILTLVMLLFPLLAACGGGDDGGGNAPIATNTELPAQTSGDPTGIPASTMVPAGDTTPAAGESPAATQPAGQTDQGQGSANRQGTKGGTAVVGIVQEPDILDPFVTGMTFSIWILHTLDTPMIRAGKGGKLEPMLLREVPTLENKGISQDGKTYTINFKPNLKWSDGQPLTARDFVFTHKTIMNPAYGAGSTLGWEEIQSIKLTNNDQTATIQLKRPYVPFFAAVLAGTGDTSGGFLLPEHKFKGMQPAQYAKSDYGLVGSAGHVGSGPFKIQSWRKGSEIRLVRNENYFGPEPFLDGMVFSVLENADQQTTQLQNNELDLATNYTEGDIPTIENLSGQGVTLIANPAVGSIERYYFNYQDPKDPNIRLDPAKAKPHPIFGDKNVRMAIAMAMNRPAIAEKLLYGKTKPGVTELDNTQWFNENLKPYPYDPAQANQLLDQAGWVRGGDGIRAKNGVRLSFTHKTTSGNPLRERVQRGVINDLKQVGVEMKIANEKPDKLFANYSQGGTSSTGNFDMVGFTTGISPLDPDLTPFYDTSQIPTKKNGGVGSNYNHYSNPEVDKLLDQQATEVDPEKRKALLDQIQQKVYDDVGVVYMYDRLRIEAAGPKLKGFAADPTAGLWWNTEDWYLEGGGQ